MNIEAISVLHSKLTAGFIKLLDSPVSTEDQFIVLSHILSYTPPGGKSSSSPVLTLYGQLGEMLLKDAQIKKINAETTLVQNQDPTVLATAQQQGLLALAKALGS